MAPGTTGQRSPAERRWSENLDAPVPSRRRAHAVEIDWSRRLETRRQRFAGAAVESLARAWSLQTQNASPLRRDQECVRNASREHCHAAASERLLATINVDEDLALQHVEGLLHHRRTTASRPRPRHVRSEPACSLPFRPHLSLSWDISTMTRL